MKTLIKIAATVILGLGFVFLLNACKKDPANGYMTVQMTDAPADFLKVNVEVVDVQVHHEIAGWTSLPTNAGIYNLLDLQNNVSVALASHASVPAGKLNQLRLILGANNSLITVTDTFELKVPSGAETGLKMNLNHTLSPNKHMIIVLDFDAAASVVDQGNGSYSLKPVIKVKSVSEL